MLYFVNRTTLVATLALALPLAAAAQTKSATTTKPAATQQVTEVTEDLDPATGKVIRRTTRTITVPAGTALPTATTTATPVPSPTTNAAADDAPVVAANDTAVSDFFREKTVVSRLTAPQLLSTYTRFIQTVRDDRQGWKATDWYKAATVLSSLNNRYNQLRDSFSLDDKLTIRSQQAEFQALRTARQLSDKVSDKL